VQHLSEQDTGHVQNNGKPCVCADKVTRTYMCRQNKFYHTTRLSKVNEAETH
jgi:hypothetical protein